MIIVGRSASEDPVELSRHHLGLVAEVRLSPPLTITVDIPARFNTLRLVRLALCETREAEVRPSPRRDAGPHPARATSNPRSDGI